MATKISCYILTYNRAHHLERVLASLSDIPDELVVVDSGSVDGTQDVAARFGARVIHRDFDNFTAQRKFAVSQCRHDWVLTIDSDEVVSPELAERLRVLKQTLGAGGASEPDAYAIRREWYTLGRRIHSFYPSLCPDFPIRLFRKDRATYLEGRQVHETLRGFRKADRIDASLLHYSCDSVDELYGKMNLYTTLAARDLLVRRGRPSFAELLLLPRLISLKWFLWHGGWRDGFVGIILARYVYDTVYQKHLKARYDSYPEGAARPNRLGS
jgi:glycosyltransferase involved in cell wall biosynthesis